MIAFDNFYVSVVGAELEDSFFRKELNYNAELAFFAIKGVVSGDMQSYLQKVETIVDRYPVKYALHGPFMEIFYDSRDRDVTRLAREKVLTGLDVARRMKAGHIVFHSTYNPLSRKANKRYDDFWVEQSASFWKNVLKYAEDAECVIAMENIFDDKPDPIIDLVREVNSPNFKICMDVGHANIFGDVDIVSWVRAFGDDLVHIHAHDNFGQEDLHLGVGEGNIDYGSFFAELSRLEVSPDLVLEVRGNEQLKKSMQFLRDNKIIDF